MENQKDSIKGAIKRNLSLARIFSLISRGVKFTVQNGFEAATREVAFRVSLMIGDEPFWYRADIPLKKELRRQAKEIFPKMPLVSVVVPLYNTNIKFLQQMLKSCLRQSYIGIEIVLVDASDESLLPYINSISRADKRIKYIKLAENSGICENTTVGLRAATGEIITLLDHDDLLYANAAYEVVAAYNKGYEFIYSDEIVLEGELNKLKSYHFKPDYSPDFLRSCNYITHLSAFTKKLLEKAGVYEQKQYEGAGDYDLILRLCENTRQIYHIKKVLYTWRSHSGSTASDISTKPYAINAGAAAINSHLARVSFKGKAAAIQGLDGCYRVKYEIIGQPKISVVIPSHEHKSDLEKCIASLYKYAGYDNFELIIAENNSKTDEIFQFYETLELEYKNLKVLKYKGEFNFSAICNFAVANAKGEHILLLNNDIEVLSEGFLTELLSYSQREDIGAVGAKLYFPNDTIQHAGVIIGINGSAGHSHKSHRRDNAGDICRLAVVNNYSAVTGACLMVKKSLYDKLNGLDEDGFAVAYNDVDFCLKLREKGFYNVFTPFAQCYHYESLSRGAEEQNSRRYQKYLQERQNFATKYKQYFEQGDPYYNPHFTYKYENYGYK